MTEKVLVAIDLEDLTLTDKMLQIASEIAGAHSAQVTLLHVNSELPPSVILHLPENYHKAMSTRLAQQLEDMVEHLNLQSEATHVAVRHGSVYREILEQAESDDTDLIIVGCHKPDATDLFLGPNASRVARHAPCSVYVVR